MSPAQMLRAAAEARNLASLICEGKAPKMDRDDWSLCACGWITKAVGGADDVYGESYALERIAWPGAMLYPVHGVWPERLVSSGLMEHGPDGAVFPLLALADALEERAAEGAL